MARYFVDGDFSLGSFLLPDDVAHHAIRVCRMRVGQELVLFNRNGQEALAILMDAGKKATADIFSIQTADRASPLKITLIQALPSMDRMDTIIQKATELGVFRICPVITARSSRLDDKRAIKKYQHWTSLVISACEQSYQTHLPTIAPLCTIDEVLDHNKNSDVKYLLNPQSEQKFSIALRSVSSKLSEVTLFVGAEGGFDFDEILAIESAGFQSVCVGPRVLRTETAGPATIAIMQAFYGDF